MHQNLLIRLAAGVFLLLLAASAGFAQESKPDEAKNKTDAAQAVQDNQQKANEQLQKQREALREHQQQTREKARDAREAARDKNQEQRQAARKEVRDADNRQQRQDARNEAQDTRNSARDTRQEARDESREHRQDARSDTRQRIQSFFRGRTGSDLGLSFDNQDSNRLTILNLDQNSLGARIGLRRGDVILSVNGQNVRSNDDFNNWIAANPERASTIMFQRNGRQYTVQLQPQSDNSQSYGYESRNMNAPRSYLGVTFDPNYREFAVVREVKSDSPAEKIGLKPGDTLTHISGREVRSLQHAVQTLATMTPGEEFELEFDRPQHQSVKVSMVERDQANRQEQN